MKNRIDNYGIIFYDKKEIIFFYFEIQEKERGEARMICPNCHREIQSGNYCSHCGFNLKDEAVCPFCGGVQSRQDGSFCRQCGKRMASKQHRGFFQILMVAAALAVVLLAWKIADELRDVQSPSAAETLGPLATQDTFPQQAFQEAEPTILETIAKSDYTGPSQPAADPGPKRPVAVDGGNRHTVILYSDGTVVTIGDDTYAQRSTSGWRDIVQVSTFADHTLGLKSDGTVVAAGSNMYGQCEVSDWTDIVAVTAGSRHSVGVKSDGTVVAVGANQSGQCDVAQWKNVRAVAANNTSTFALTEDGRVLTCGSFQNSALNNWSDIVSISVSSNHVVGVHSDGTVSAVGSNNHGQCDNLEKWLDTRMVAVGEAYTAGLREKGTVWVHGIDDCNQHAAMHWSDVVAIGTGTEHIIGIKEDGTLVAVGEDDCGQCDVYNLNQMLLP